MFDAVRFAASAACDKPVREIAFCMWIFLIVCMSI